MRALLAILLCVSVGTAMAIDTGAAFEDPEMQARYERLIEEVRCLKCQNQNLRDSNAFLASDLRREIRRLMREGRTDAEIFDFLVSRYGEFALYRPRMSGKTLVLWIAPMALLLGGGLLVFNIVRKRTRLPVDEVDAPQDGRAG